MIKKEDENRKTKRLAVKLFLASSLMFGFGYALIPLYSLLCDLTGLAGKANNNVQVVVDSKDAQTIDMSREVIIELVANNYHQDTWYFEPVQHKITAHPGEFLETKFVAKNLTNLPQKNMSSYNLAPAESSLYFQKIQCFCFTEQTFEPQEERDMPVIFRISPDIPEKIKTITLAYQINPKE